MGQWTLIVIGGGNMGRAIVQGAVRSGMFTRHEVVVAEPDADRRATFQGLAATVSTAKQATDLSTSHPEARVVLAIKPQIFAQVAEELSPLALLHNRLVASVMAGVTTAGLSQALGTRCRIVRAMPNLPLAVQRGMTAFCMGAGAGEDDRRFASGLFGTMGEVLEVGESMMDAFTAVAGSGPAYVFYLAEAMIKGAKAAGLNESDADKIVRQTIRGAATLMCSSDPAAMKNVPVDQIRERVTSKGGTTQAATQVLDENEVMEAFARAILAAKQRGRELATETGGAMGGESRPDVIPLMKPE